MAVEAVSGGDLKSRKACLVLYLYFVRLFGDKKKLQLLY